MKNIVKYIQTFNGHMAQKVLEGLRKVYSNEIILTTQAVEYLNKYAKRYTALEKIEWFCVDNDELLFKLIEFK